MKKLFTFYLPFSVLLIGLPIGGVWLAGHDVADYLEFPPRTQHVEHAPFSWPVFVGLTIVILATMLPFLYRIGRALSTKAPRTVHRTVPTHTFPWWGWLGLGFGVLCWIAAWTRFPWLEALQRYTFTPQWIAYIVVINALTYRQTGRCMMTHETRSFLWLFPLSAVFWWFFEYLNRFVQNWWYTTGTDFTQLQYFITATLAFSTVLPAVLSTEEWLKSYPRCYAGLQEFGRIKSVQPKTIAKATLVAAGTGLLLIGTYPDYLFPLLWVAPLLIMIALNCLAGNPSFFPEINSMDFSRVYRLALAALICGFFWELWNWHSLAKWIYAVPYVHRFQLFEMPILGYAGYLPFGLECAVVADLIRRSNTE